MPHPQKIIVCCDGTWQSSTSGQDNIPSNITRLARHLAGSSTDAQQKEWNQVVYYDSGVGTGDIGLQSMIQGGSGRGLDTNVIEAYNFIVLNYNKGDKIYCFGFSRGAYTARAVAGLVTDIGVIKPRDMQEFPALYRLYQENCGGDEFRTTKQYHDWIQGVPAEKQDDNVDMSEILPEGFIDASQAAGKDLRKVNWKIRPHGFPDQETRFVEVCGVWDTVGSLGIPDVQGIDLSFLRKSYGFHNVKLSPFIKNAYHALAIDERRGPFSPTLWYIPYGRAAEHAKLILDKTDHDKRYSEAKKDDEKIAIFKDKVKAMDAETLKSIAGTQLLYQVWFPGMHINIGGGSDDFLKEKKGDLEQIANITFCWMAEMLRPHLALDTDAIDLFEQERMDALDRVSRMKDYGGTYTGSMLNHGLEFLGVKHVDTYKIDDETKFGWATGDLEDSFAGYMRLAGAKVRRPGACQEDRTRAILATLGHTWEFVHPCTAYRLERLKNYKPEALKGYSRKPRTDKGKQVGYQWVKEKDGVVWDAKQEKMVKGDLIIPEWVIYPSKSQFGDRSFERACMSDEAHGWVKKNLDAIYEGDDWWQTLQKEPSKS